LYSAASEISSEALSSSGEAEAILLLACLTLPAALKVDSEASENFEPALVRELFILSFFSSRSWVVSLIELLTSLEDNPSNF